MRVNGIRLLLAVMLVATAALAAEPAAGWQAALDTLTAKIEAGAAWQEKYQAYKDFKAVYDEGDEVVYCVATPRAWLDPGKKIRVERLQTRFGPTSFTLKAERDRITGEVELPTRYAPKVAKLRIRTRGKLTSVKLNGQSVPFDEPTGMVALPEDARRVTVQAAVARGVDGHLLGVQDKA